MPYGVRKTAGGDSPTNDLRMKRCVAEVMAKGQGKISAIKICKTSIFGPETKGTGGGQR